MTLFCTMSDCSITLIHSLIIIIMIHFIYTAFLKGHSKVLWSKCRAVTLHLFQGCVQGHLVELKANVTGTFTLWPSVFHLTSTPAPLISSSVCSGYLPHHLRSSLSFFFMPDLLVLVAGSDCHRGFLLKYDHLYKTGETRTKVLFLIVCLKYQPSIQIYG